MAQTNPEETEVTGDSDSPDAHIDMGRVDEAELTAIKTQRVLTDPYIIHEAMKTRDYTVPEGVQSDIDVARFQQHQETPLTDPIRQATWPETSIYLSTLSLVEPLTGEACDMYMWAFAKHMVETRGLSLDRVEGVVGRPVEPPAPHLRRKLAALRKQIKVDRDKQYLDTEYSGESSVPKRYWTAWHTQTATVEPAEFRLDALGGSE